ncbi:ethanolamine utilization protein EutJ [uncultured Clostridium sp.]|uniref:type IV pilus assembly protein PilM n=1 Tax=uncultured Clostridium sp. TaxID=59620 RepID=UPI0008234DCD|nr:type IV pilus assembly protein PilM [uncultured Clostridium sp.]SCK00885.1 ethanolamine utilization protein EutJ [uncultured Clostridium sp.]
MSEEKKKRFDFSKLKEIGQMDIKDLTKGFKNKKIEVKIPVKRKKSRNIISFDIGSSTIKIVVGKYSREKLVINKCIDIVTPDGVINDGRIVNQDTLKDIMKFSLNENKIKSQDVIVTTNSSLVINREIVIPKVEADEIDTVIRYEIQQYLPINLDDYILQFIILGELEDESGQKLKVNVIAYPDKIARGYYDLINSIGLTPYVLDVTYNSINKIANYSELSKVGEKGTVAFVDMGGNSVNVTVLKDGKLDFTRMIKNGGANIDFALSQKLNMSVKSTESIKIEKGNLLDIKDDDVINNTLKICIDEIVMDLERIIKFYSNKSVGNKIDKIFIYGGISSIKWLDKYLEEKFNIEIEKIDKLKNVEFTSKELKELSMEQYLNAIGAIIRL